MMKHLKTIIAVAACLGIGATFEANATQVFARKEKKMCNFCHLKDGGGNGWGFRGIYYKAHKMSFKGFVEKTEAKKAGVKEGAMGAAAKPTKPYKG